MNFMALVMLVFGGLMWENAVSFELVSKAKCEKDKDERSYSARLHAIE